MRLEKMDHSLKLEVAKYLAALNSIIRTLPNGDSIEIPLITKPGQPAEQVIILTNQIQFESVLVREMDVTHIKLNELKEQTNDSNSSKDPSGFNE